MPDGRSSLTVRCCIVGGGPAGMMLGFLLARQGIDVAVLEKWPDFFRDFRGDTIHPSTMDVLGELGVLEAFLKLPHQEVRQLSGFVGGEELPVADLRHLKVRCPFLAFIPQWDFLDFIGGQARAYPGFHLLMKTAAVDLRREGDRVCGVIAQGPQGDLEIHAELVIAADGRHSTVRDAARLAVEEFGAPIDVLWFGVSRRETDPGQAFGRIERGHFMVMLDRQDYWQCGFVIGKGGFDDLRAAGLPAFRDELLRLAPFLGDRVSEVSDWDKVKLLSVKVDRLRQWWQPGLLLIGDAAHAMSPVGGVGINLAIQDAVAAANILIPAARRGSLADADLAAVQRRREFPTRATQWLQVQIQNRVLRRVLGPGKAIQLPLILRLLRHFKWPRRIPARVIGIGFRPEHVAPEWRVAKG
jgi:2-polyprenyl-6-methoxyphenol hydroxylase-like FAD-dependent oxidoreductase